VIRLVCVEEKSNHIYLNNNDIGIKILYINTSVLEKFEHVQEFEHVQGQFNY